MRRRRWRRLRRKKRESSVEFCLLHANLLSPSTTTTTETSKPKPPPKEPIPVNLKEENIDKSKNVNNEPRKPEPKSEPPTISSLQDENAALRARITQLQSDLQEAQDFVFSLQPRHQTLTEPEAVEEFTALCAAVEDWVDQNLGDSIDEMVVSKERLRPKDTQNLMDLIPPAGKAAFDAPSTDMDIIQTAILRFLNDVIFSQDFYCPLPSSERQFVMTVERSMRDLQPRRGITFPSFPLSLFIRFPFSILFGSH